MKQIVKETASIEEMLNDFSAVANAVIDKLNAEETAYAMEQSIDWYNKYKKGLANGESGFDLTITDEDNKDFTIFSISVTGDMLAKAGDEKIAEFFAYLGIVATFGIKTYYAENKDTEV